MTLVVDDVLSAELFAVADCLGVSVEEVVAEGLHFMYEAAGFSSGDVSADAAGVVVLDLCGKDGAR